MIMTAQDDDNLDDILKRANVNEKTEMGEVASELFANTPSRTNITQDEMTLLFVNKALFRGLGIAELSPVNDFIELKKSVGGWNVEQFVRSMGGLNEQRKGFLGTMKDKLFGGGGQIR